MIVDNASNGSHTILYMILTRSIDGFASSSLPKGVSYGRQLRKVEIVSPLGWREDLFPEGYDKDVSL